MARNKGKRKKKSTRSRSGKRTRQRKRSGNGESANAVAEEDASVDADLPQLPPESPLLEQALPSPESVMTRSGGRLSWKTVASRIWDAVRELMGWGFNEEELDEESKPEDPRVTRILDTMDRILDLQEEAWRKGELNRAELLQRAYDLLKIFLRKIKSATI